jgi:hypothetical protein
VEPAASMILNSVLMEDLLPHNIWSATMEMKASRVTKIDLNKNKKSEIHRYCVNYFKLLLTFLKYKRKRISKNFIV